MQRGTAHAPEVAGGVHQRHVGERLREVAELAPRRRGRTPRRAGRRRCARPSSRSNSARASSTRPEQREVVGEPERARRGTRPRRAGRPSTPLVGSCSGARSRRRSSSRSIGVDGAGDARVGRGQEADERHHQQRGVELLRAVGLGERVALGVEALRAAPRAWISSRHAPPPVDRARRGRTPRRPCTARSNATHAITFECVKCWRGPRTSQMPSSGSLPAPTRGSRAARSWTAQRARARPRCPMRRAWCSASRTSPYTSSWNCSLRGVADPHRASSPRSRGARRARTRSAAARRPGRT